MNKRAVICRDAPKPIGPYQQAIRAGNLLYTSGQIGVEAESERLAEGIAAQTRMALKNLALVLQAGGASLEDVVKTTVFLANMDDFAAMNSVYAEFFSSNPPARSAIQVARLPKSALVEIEAVALVR